MHKFWQTVDTTGQGEFFRASTGVGTALGCTPWQALDMLQWFDQTYCTSCLDQCRLQMQPGLQLRHQLDHIHGCMRPVVQQVAFHQTCPGACHHRRQPTSPMGGATQHACTELLHAHAMYSSTVHCMAAGIARHLDDPAPLQIWPRSLADPTHTTPALSYTSRPGT